MFLANVQGHSTNFPVLTNITGGTPTSVAVATAPSHEVTGSPRITSIPYTPTAGYAGADSFTYTANNGAGTSPAAATSITVTPLTAVVSASLMCPPGASTYVCGSGATGANTFSGNVLTFSVTDGIPPYSCAWTGAGDGHGHGRGE